MSILDKKGISVTSGFKLISGQPLDARNVVDDLYGLQDLINNGAAYEGIVVYVKSEQQLKQYNGNKWMDVLNDSSGGGSSSSSSDFVNVDELPDVFVGTEVPSSGMVEKIYFNTNLSNDEIKGIVYSIVPQNLGELGTLYPICTNSTMTNALVITTYGNQNQDRALVNVVDGVSDVLWNTTDNQWLDVTEVSLSYENYLSLLAPQFGVTVQNDKLKNLISTTPYTKNTSIKLDKIYRVSPHESDSVPNNGYVDKIYFNTGLSAKEVDDILSRLIYDNNAYTILENENGTIKIIAVDLFGTFSIMDEVSGYIYYMNGGELSDWNSFPNPIIINSNVQNTVGAQNELLNTLCYIRKENGISSNIYQYYRVIDNKWEEVLSTTKLPEELPIIIKKLQPRLEQNEITLEEFELMDNNINVIIRTGVSSVFGGEHIYTKTASGVIRIGEDGNITKKLIAFTTTTDSGILETYNIIDNEGVISISSVEVPYIHDKTTKVEQYSGSVVTSGAVYDYVRKQIGSSGGSSDFIDVELLPDTSNADLDKIYRIPEKKVINGTAIPNSGTISNLYFNTLLTTEEIKEIINQLQWIDGATLGQAGIEFYPILAYMNGSYPYVLGLQRFTAGDYTGITNLFIINFATMEQVYKFYLEVSSGWQSFENPYTMNATVLSELSGIPIGYQNELLKTMISTTLFEIGTTGYKYYRAINGEWVEVLNEVNMTYIIEKNYGDIKNNTLTFTTSEWEIIKNNTNVKIKAIIDDGMHALFDKQTYIKVINEEVASFTCGGGSIGANNSVVPSNSTLIVIKSNWQYTVLFETFSNNTYIIDKNYDDVIGDNTLTFTTSEWEIIRNNSNVKVRSLKDEVVGSNIAHMEVLFEKSYYGNTGIADIVLFQSCMSEFLSQEVRLSTLTVIRDGVGQHTSAYSDINLTKLANGV